MMNPSDADSLSAVSALPVPIAPGHVLPLSSVATVHEVISDQRISRDDRIPSVTITANLYGPTSLGEVMRHVDGWAKSNLSAPYKIRYAGNSDVLNDAKSQIMMAIVVAVGGRWRN